MSDTPSIHGFILLGDPTVANDAGPQILLYHSSVFAMPPHAYQMAIGGQLPMDIYNTLLNDMAAYGRDGAGGYVRILHNIEPMTLPDVASGNVKSFRAAIRRKNLSTGDYPLITGEFEMPVTSVVYYRPFTPGEQYPPKSKYVLFRIYSGQAYLAHYLTRAPDYDAVMGLYVPEGISMDTQAMEVYCEQIPAYQGGTLPSASPFAINRNYHFSAPGGGSYEWMPSDVGWFDTKVINGNG